MWEVFLSAPGFSYPLASLWRFPLSLAETATDDGANLPPVAPIGAWRQSALGRWRQSGWVVAPIGAGVALWLAPTQRETTGAAHGLALRTDGECVAVDRHAPPGR